MNRESISRLLAEFIGSYFLIFTGCGAAVVSAGTGAFTHLGVSLAFGAIVLILIYSYGNLSGAHLNPAVTIAFTIARRFSPRMIPGYILAQFAGTIAAAFTLRMIFPEADSLGATLPAVSTGQAFLLEMIFSFILMTVALNVSTGYKEKGIMAGVAIGSTVFLLALIGGPLTGASMNPARSLGPALAGSQMESIWVYLTAPFVGTALAVIPGRITTQAELA